MLNIRIALSFLRFFNLKLRLKLGWCHAQDLLRITMVTTGMFELGTLHETTAKKPTVPYTLTSSLKLGWYCAGNLLSIIKFQ